MILLLVHARNEIQQIVDQSRLAIQRHAIVIWSGNRVKSERSEMEITSKRHRRRHISAPCLFSHLLVTWADLFRLDRRWGVAIAPRTASPPSSRRIPSSHSARRNRVRPAQHTKKARAAATRVESGGRSSAIGKAIDSTGAARVALYEMRGLTVAFRLSLLFHPVMNRSIAVSTRSSTRGSSNLA